MDSSVSPCDNPVRSCYYPQFLGENTGAQKGFVAFASHTPARRPGQDLYPYNLPLRCKAFFLSLESPRGRSWGKAVYQRIRIGDEVSSMDTQAFNQLGSLGKEYKLAPQCYPTWGASECSSMLKLVHRSSRSWLLVSGILWVGQSWVGSNDSIHCRHIDTRGIDTTCTTNRVLLLLV